MILRCGIQEKLKSEHAGTVPKRTEQPKQESVIHTPKQESRRVLSMPQISKLVNKTSGQGTTWLYRSPQ
jgi:hypothetical protein